MSPVLNEIIKKANLPFEGCESLVPDVMHLPEEHELKSLCFLPRVRIRRCYEADSDSKAPSCTKKSTAHPSLTPGIFTLFCPHG